MRRPRQQHQHQQDPARDPGGSKLLSKIAHGARAPHRREERGGGAPGFQGCGMRDAGCAARCRYRCPLRLRFRCRGERLTSRRQHLP